MSELLKQLGDWRKIGGSLALVVAIMTGLLIFLPDRTIRTAGLGEVKDQILPYLGILFFASVAILLAGLIEFVVTLAKTEVSDLINHWRWSKVLSDLTGDEKKVLREFIDDGKTAISAPLSDPVISTLAVKKILVRTSNMGHPGSMSFPFTLQPWARKALNRKGYLLAP